MITLSFCRVPSADAHTPAGTIEGLTHAHRKLRLMTEHAERSARPRVYDIVTLVASLLFLISPNIRATKSRRLMRVNPIWFFDGGAVLFHSAPTFLVAFSLKVYGLARARKDIIMGFLRLCWLR